MIKKDKIRFVLKVTAAHVITYIICGIFFSTVLNYEELWQSGALGDQQRDYNSIFVSLGPFLQVIRGLLFGGILLQIPKEFFQQKYGWLKLWMVVAGIGILNTPGSMPGSIEGFIYASFPLEAYKTCFEIFTQTLWFSWLVCRTEKEKSLAAKMAVNYKYPLIAAGITVVGISLSGFLIAALKGIDITGGTQDPGALLLMVLSSVIMFLITIWYLKKPAIRLIAFLFVCYLMNGVHTIIYNYLTASPFQSLLPLLTALVITFLIWLLIRRESKQESGDK